MSVNTILNNLTVIVQNRLTEHHCVPTSHFEVNIIAYSVKAFKRPQKASKAFRSVTADQTPASAQKSTLSVRSDGQKIKDLSKLRQLLKKAISLALNNYIQ